MRRLTLCLCLALCFVLLAACTAQEQPKVDARDLDPFSPDALCAYHIGDPTAGEVTFNQPVLGDKGGCVTCHSVEPEIVLVGPSLYGIATTAAERIPGVIAANYIYVSIVEPDYHLVEGYESASMLAGYQDSLSQDEITDLVSYLMTLTVE